jgi:hypothetical protein
VFFAPLELTPDKDAVNLELGRRSTRQAFRWCCSIAPWSRTPSGACTISWASTTGAPATGSPNTCCGSASSMRIAFVGVEHAAATVQAREAGYREALHM